MRKAMSRRITGKVSIVGVCLLSVVGAAWLLIGNATTVTAAESNDRTPEASFTDAGSEGCLRCHAGETMALMNETAHGDANDPFAPFAKKGCESCHGPGSLHVSRARGGAGFPPLLRFHEQGDPNPEQLGACLNCHGQAMGDRPGMEWAGSLHDTGNITCSSCHQLHAAQNILVDPVAQKASCSRCHKRQITDHSRFEQKGIVFDKLSCHDCHDAHQLIGR
jgi:DmsE family decaheme c-type cytochrome